MCAFDSSLASQAIGTQAATTINKDDNSSSSSCEIYVMENKIREADIGFATIAAICILAGLLLALAGMSSVHLGNL